MNIGIVGLGLIGGSMAKAIKTNTEHNVWGRDLQIPVVKKAVLIGAIDEELTDEKIKACDFIIICLFPQDTIDFVKFHKDKFKKNSIVVDCCGVKEIVCSALEPVAAEQGFTFIGGHPMAGLEHTGFKYSKTALFNRASMIITPPKGTAIEVVLVVKKLFESIGFANTQITTAQEHDEIIAFTSQLAHVISSAYIKSPTALLHDGFSAGSYKDMTRVAKLNEDMWTELFLENPTNLCAEIDGIIERLSQYSAAIKSQDATLLREMLLEGKERKLCIDKERF